MRYDSGVFFGVAANYKNLYQEEDTDAVKILDYKDSYYKFRNAGIVVSAVSGIALTSSLITYIMYTKSRNETPVTKIKVSFVAPGVSRQTVSVNVALTF